jgi:hypothetical protein
MNGDVRLRICHGVIALWLILLLVICVLQQ